MSGKQPLTDLAVRAKRFTSLGLRKNVDKFFSWLISKVPGSRAPWDFKDMDSDGEHDDFEKPEDECQCRKKKS